MAKPEMGVETEVGRNLPPVLKGARRPGTTSLRLSARESYTLYVDRVALCRFREVEHMRAAGRT